MVKDALPLGSYDSVDLIVLEVSVADSGAVWNLCQAFIGESQRFGARLYYHLQTTNLPLRDSSWPGYWALVEMECSTMGH